MNPNMYSNVISLLYKIKKMPEIYLFRKSILLLESFIGGFIYAHFIENGYESSEENFTGKFNTWVANRYNISDSLNWASMIMLQMKDEEKAFDLFYELLDEYLMYNIK
jgi:hypothetical protein